MPTLVRYNLLGRGVLKAISFVFLKFRHKLMATKHCLMDISFNL